MLSHGSQKYGLRISLAATQLCKAAGCTSITQVAAAPLLLNICFSPAFNHPQHPGKIIAHDFDFGARTVKAHSTFGRADGTHAEHPALFLKSHAKEPNLPSPTLPTASASSKLKLKGATPTRDDKPVMGLTSNKNFVTVNAVKAILMEPKKLAEPPTAYTSVRTTACWMHF